MSINSALLAGVSGLTANSAALAAISQNIANVNTVGYKRSAAEFSTVINSQVQGAGYSAGGVLASARHYTSQAGQLQRTPFTQDLTKSDGVRQRVRRHQFFDATHDQIDQGALHAAEHFAQRRDHDMLEAGLIEHRLQGMPKVF